MYDINLSMTLIRLGDHLRRNRPDYYRCLQSALAASEQEMRSKPYGWDLPKEVFTLYQWKNGQGATNCEFSFLWDFRFLSLEASLTLAKQQQIATNLPHWRPGWLPLFSNKSGAIICYDTEGTGTRLKGQLLLVDPILQQLQAVAPSLNRLISLLNDFYTSNPQSTDFEQIEIQYPATYPIPIELDPLAIS